MIIVRNMIIMDMIIIIIVLIIMMIVVFVVVMTIVVMFSGFVMFLMFFRSYVLSVTFVSDRCMKSETK